MDTRQILEEFPAYLEANRLARPQHGRRRSGWRRRCRRWNGKVKAMQARALRGRQLPVVGRLRCLVSL